MIRETTQDDIAQEEEEHEDVDMEQIIVNNEVDVHHDIIIQEIGLEQGEHTSLEEEVNQQVRTSTRERRQSVRYPSSYYILFNEHGEAESFLDVLDHKDNA